jgi:hypothetical protein
MVFKGDAAPTAMDLILISHADPADTTLHNALIPLLGNKSMIVATPAEIAAAAAQASIPDTHPVLLAAADPEMDAALEDAAQGGFEGTGKLLKRKGGRKVSSLDLAKAKAKAEMTGQDGEGLVNSYLAAKAAAGEIAGFTWVSADNAIAPCDFETVSLAGDHTLIDVKSTTGPFENEVHVSLAEIIEASGTKPYRIYRVFDLNEDGGKLRISDDIRSLAQHLKAVHESHMPAGIRVDGFSVATSVMKWGTEEHVERPDE